MPLPLFPRLIDFYLSRESHDPTTFLSRSLGFFRHVRAVLASSSSSVAGKEGTGITGANKRWDVVLLGGVMGSAFSLCQCVISPYLGRREYDTRHARVADRDILRCCRGPFSRADSCLLLSPTTPFTFSHSSALAGLIYNAAVRDFPMIRACCDNY